MQDVNQMVRKLADARRDAETAKAYALALRQELEHTKRVLANEREVNARQRELFYQRMDQLRGEQRNDSFGAWLRRRFAWRGERR